MGRNLREEEFVSTSRRDKVLWVGGAALVFAYVAGSCGLEIFEPGQDLRVVGSLEGRVVSEESSLMNMGGKFEHRLVVNVGGSDVNILTGGFYEPWRQKAEFPPGKKVVIEFEIIGTSGRELLRSPRMIPTTEETMLESFQALIDEKRDLTTSPTPLWRKRFYTDGNGRKQWTREYIGGMKVTLKSTDEPRED